MTAPTDTDPRDTWEAANLRALIAKRKMTQNAVADAAGIDRTIVNALTRARRDLTQYYAEKLGPVLKVKAAELRPPAKDDAEPESPLRRLEVLEDQALRTADLGPILHVLQLLATGKRAEALRALSEVVGE